MGVTNGVILLKGHTVFLTYIFQNSFKLLPNCQALRLTSIFLLASVIFINFLQYTQLILYFSIYNELILDTALLTSTQANFLLNQCCGILWTKQLM